MTDRISWTWRHAVLKSGLKPTTRHVLLTLSCYMNDIGGGCYPTTKQLAASTGLSERAVCTHLELAFASGWINRKRHGFAGQRWANHEYEPSFPEDKGTEPSSVRTCEGTEPNDKKALNLVQSKVSDKVPYKNTPIVTLEIAVAVSEWNTFAHDNKLSEVKKFTKARQAALEARLKDCGGLDGWRHALTLVKASPFLMGQNDRGWTVDFDFLCRESRFTKLMEGGYAPRHSDTNGHGPNGRARSRENRQMDAFREAGREADCLD